MSEDQAALDQILAGYRTDEAVLDLGVLMADGEPIPGGRIALPLSMMNRHGLVAGATGTGKTKTLQLMAEQLSANGVAVFAADIKGDLSGIALPGEASEKLLARTQKIGQQWQGRGFPTEFYALGGEGTGIPLRATVSSFGPILLSKVLDLNDVQESSLGLVFHYADSAGLPLLDLSDLQTLLTYLTSADGKAELDGIGGLSKATVGVILRKIVTLSAQGADAFFGEPEFDTLDLLRVTPDGRGVVSLLELPGLMDRPALFSTFLMWLLADLYAALPEVGDVDKPKLVFFFDEAHLLFDDASKAFLEAITQTVRLIRSKGIGVFFVTQTPTDVPEDVLAQLGSRVQHQIRAHTPKDAKALKATVETFPTSGYDLAETLQSLGIGEAVVTVLNPDGAPTPVAWTRMRAPESLMAAMDPQMMATGVSRSQQMATYGTAIDRESAREILTRKLEAGAQAAAQEQEAAAQDAQRQREATATAKQREKEELAAQKAREREEAAAARQREKDDAARAKQAAKARDDAGKMVGRVAGNLFSSMARSAGNAIVRDLFGTARKR
ncbi:helicase HerA-like domain-containing protein [Propionicicella superfundia]|uniref:helicase HerA-like domain-containing protein n=1 Tax=Propionicicella superfundia TaxID=348582 RepID=UPI00040DFCDC|nr:helicase HerA-like domain-containing protein [Propionicicella superfundia]